MGSIKLDTLKIIERFKLKHGDKYDYSKVNYVNTHEKVCIICPEHGEFWQTPHDHLRGNGCPKCARQRKTTQGFILKAIKKHGGKYDYSKANYIGCKKKICIICPKHGEFWQMPNTHLSGCGCQECKKEAIHNSLARTHEQFIEKAKEIHGDKYDYSKVEYKNTETKVCIICPEHGEFWQTPHKHLNGRGCPTCGNLRKGNSSRGTKEVFIKKARKVHGDKYDYSKVDYTNAMTKVCIICPKHGEFWQTPAQHICGNGCKECRKEYLHNKFVFTKDDFIKRAKKIHNDKYDYSMVEYNGMHKKVHIICPVHGEFWQTPHSHLKNEGCPSCRESKMEKYIANKLSEENIKFVRSKRFKWLKMKGSMHLDFYLPDYNVAIECQGIQHFEECSWYKNDEDKTEYLKKIIERDETKQRLCLEHNIKIVYYTTYDFKKSDINIYNEYNTFSTFNKIKKTIYDLRV